MLLVVVSWRSGHTCMLRVLLVVVWGFFNYAKVLSSILKASLIHTVNPFLASKT